VTDDIDVRLDDARPRDPADEPVQELLARVRRRVDAERAQIVPARARRSRPRSRLALVAAAAAVITAVPVVASVVGQDDDGLALLPVAVAVDGNGEVFCAGGYAGIVDPADAAVRLLPDRLPAGWDYTEVLARHETSLDCDAPSLVALRLDPAGVVTGRVAVSGPFTTSTEAVLGAATVPDTVLGHPARRFDIAPGSGPADGVEVHRWVWSDDAGRVWTAEAVGLGLDDARRQLTGVSVDGDAVTWAAVDPGWTLAHLRTGPPYVLDGGDVWRVQLTGGVEGRGFDVQSGADSRLPAAARAWVGDRLTDLDGHAAVLSPPRGGEAEGGAPGSAPLVTIAVDVEPGVTATTRVGSGDVAAVEQMLTSLRQVPADDARLEQYGTD
jgi:hypothetical protein